MEINAQKRETFGKKTKRLRNDFKLPAVIFGKHFESVPLTLDYNDFVKVYSKAGETSLVDISYDGNKEKVLIKEVQQNPITGNPIHASLYKVNLKEKITAQIPVEVTGEEKSSILKSGNGMLLTVINEIEVECLPSDLPSAFYVDVSHLEEIGQGVTIGELDFNREKVELTGDLEDDELIVKIDYAEMAEEEETAEDITEEQLLEGIEATKEKDDDEDEDQTGEETNTSKDEE